MSALPMKDRNPYIAFILSLCITGLGQFYCAQAKRGFIFVAILIPVMLLCGFVSSLDFNGADSVSNLIFFGYTLYVGTDAWRIAKNAGEIQLKIYNKIRWYVIYFMFPIIIWSIFLVIESMHYYKITKQAQEHQEAIIQETMPQQNSHSIPEQVEEATVIVMPTD